ncbi:MAG: hypothetical protein R6X10_03200 [Desulfobacterales bacterium]
MKKPDGATRRLYESTKKGNGMVLSISENDLIRVKAVLLDEDRKEALEIIRELVKRLQIQAGKGLKSHLDGR